MKNLFAITLIATLAVASSVAALENPQAAFNAIANGEEGAIAAILAARIPASTENEQALWKKKKKHHDKQKHGKHGKLRHKKCCIKYVTKIIYPECRPTP